VRSALRLRQKRDFARLRVEGQLTQHRLLKLSYAPSTVPHNRYGFIVSRRLGNAVDRNRLRRRLKEIVRQLHPHIFPDASSTSAAPDYGVDCVFIARTAAASASFHELRMAVEAVLQRARLLHW